MAGEVRAGRPGAPPLVVAATGASGAPYTRRLLAALFEMGVAVDLILSEAALAVIREEEGVDLTLEPTTEGIFSWVGRTAPEGGLRVHPNSDLTAGPSSGTYPTRGMVICPCSTGTLASVAQGVSRDLIGRAADVTLKERRPLVLVVRETPLSRVHIENMLRAHDAGACVLPASPGFYHHPRSVEDLVEFVVARVLSRLGLEQRLLPGWKAEWEGEG